MRFKYGLSLLTIWLVFHTIPAWSLGLGDARVESFIGQPLELRIELLTVPGDDLDSVSARLASADDFALIGASRSAISVPLRFAVHEGEGDSGAYILVTSRLAVSDPVLRLVIEVNWSSGRLLREYTLFLDPPTVPSQAPAPQTARAERPSAPPPVAEPAPQPQPQPQPEPESESAREPARSADTTQPPAPAAEQEAAPLADAGQPQAEPETPTPSGGAYGPVRSGETLWRVASNYIGQSGMDMNQVMLAIQRKNPEAFVDDNINLLMRGAQLDMPTSEDIDAISRQRARELVAQQEAAFRMRSSLAGASTPLLAAESTDTSAAADNLSEPSEAETPSQARLEIVPASEGDLAAEPGTGAVPGGEGEEGVRGELREELARTEEELISERQQNEYLRERISELEAQLAESGGVADGVVADEELANLEDRLQAGRLEAQDEAQDEARDAAQDAAQDAARDAGEDSAEEVAEAGTDPGMPSVSTSEAQEETPWYSGPMTWIIMVVIVIAAVVGWIINRRRGEEYDLETGASASSVSGLKGDAEEILRTLDSDPEEADREEADRADADGVTEVHIPEDTDRSAPEEPDVDDDDRKFDSDEMRDDDDARDEAESEPPVVPLEKARRRYGDTGDAQVLDENSSDPEIKLDLARAYISMGDKEAARVILAEVVGTGDEQQQSEARSMMDEL